MFVAKPKNRMSSRVIRISCSLRLAKAQDVILILRRVASFQISVGLGGKLKVSAYGRARGPKGVSQGQAKKIAGYDME